MNGVETRFDVDVARVRSSGLLNQAADPAGTSRPGCRQVDQQSTGQTSGQGGQRPVGGMAHHGQDFQSLVSVLGPQFVERLLVELTDIGRQQVERRVILKFTATGGAPGLLGQGVRRLLGVEELF